MNSNGYYSLRVEGIPDYDVNHLVRTITRWTREIDIVREFHPHGENRIGSVYLVPAGGVSKEAEDRTPSGEMASLRIFPITSGRGLILLQHCGCSMSVSCVFRPRTR